MRPMPNANIINYCHNFCLEVGFRIETYGWSIERASVSEEVRRGIDRALINNMRDFIWRSKLEGVLGAGVVSPN